MGVKMGKQQQLFPDLDPRSFSVVGEPHPLYVLAMEGE